MYKAVLFDLDNTLCDIDAARASAAMAEDGSPSRGIRESAAIARQVSRNEEAIRVLLALRLRCPVGIVSNGSAHSQREKLRRCLGETPLDAIVISGEVRARKPDPRIFRIALDALGRRADEVLFVGDDPETDMAGAVAAGLASAWLSNGRSSELLPCEVNHVLNALGDVLELVP